MMLTLKESWIRDDNYVVGAFWEGWPCEGPISQVFGQKSVTGSMHAGVDIVPPYRAPIYAPMAGYARHYSYGDFGNHVIVQVPWDDEYGQLYMIMAHMDSFVERRDRDVRAGDVLGYAGFTGKVVPADINGTHVHFAFGIDPLISGDYRRCVDPHIFIQRAELEDDMSSSRLGLQFIASGDFTKLINSYEKLRASGILDKLYPEGLAEPFSNIPPDDQLRQLNCAIVMRFQILGCAASDVADEAYVAVGGTV